MTILDAYVVIAFLRAEPGADEVRPLLDDGDAMLTAVGVADCIAAEVARVIGRPLATADPHLLALCHAEGIRTIVLPASDGTRWMPSA